MKERPIIFSAPMIRAILEGRKTQTRRVLKCDSHIERIGTPHEWNRGRADDRMKRWKDWGPRTGHALLHSGESVFALRCPYGQPGDRLWVRETWTWEGGSSTYPRDTPLPDGAYDKLYVRYAADGSKRTIETGGNVLPVPRQPPQREGEEYCLRDAPADFVYTGDNTYVDRLGRWWKRKIPAIHMPRWASRILLEVTDVRVQRVQEISDDDCESEGIQQQWTCINPGTGSYAHGNDVRDDFRKLWKSINERRGFGWNANPWVWCLTFKRVEGGERE